MRRLILISIFVLTGTGDVAFATNICVDLATGVRKSSVDGTDGLIAYLTDLQKRGIITDEELAGWMTEVEKGNISNPISAEKAQVSSASMVQREAIQGYIHHRTFDTNRLLAWIESSLSENKRIRRARNQTRVETHDLWQKMQFARVPAGSFELDEGEERRTITLTHSFEMMITPVTQKMWVDVMGVNSSTNKNGNVMVSRIINGNPVKMLPDNPAESMSWWSAAEYANRLSVRYGFPPTYDFETTIFESETNPESGTWRILEIEDSSRSWRNGQGPVDVKINAPDEDIYQAKGFRLPTLAESAYILAEIKKVLGPATYGTCGWFSDNSDMRVHRVAQLDPIKIFGQNFYDLIGNVYEWRHDGFKGYLGLYGQDPQIHPDITRDHWIGSGCYSSDSSKEQLKDQRAAGRYEYAGFRLVRTVE